LVNTTLPLSDHFPNFDVDTVIAEGESEVVNEDELEEFKNKTEFLIGEGESVDSLWSKHFRESKDFDELFEIITTHLDDKIAAYQ
jgi:hypothetical protein